MRLLRERRAVAALAFGFFATLYVVLGLLVAGDAAKMLLGMGAVYLFGFFGVAAEWFFGRWVGLGLAASGTISAALGVAQIGLEPALIVYGALHGAAWLCLLGDPMRRTFEGQRGWRDRFRLDDEGVARLGKAVTRASAALPYLVTLLLRPREPGESAALAALLLACAGLAAVLRNRTWGLVATGAAGAASIAAIVDGAPPHAAAAGWWPVAPAAAMSPRVLGALAACCALAAVAAFAGPIARYLSRTVEPR